MDIPSQTITNEQIRQHQLLLYMDSVLLDFDNVEEILKLKSKVTAAQLLLQDSTNQQ